MSLDLLSNLTAEQQAVAMVGRLRPVTNQNGLKENSGVYIGGGIVLTGSRFFTASNPTDGEITQIKVQISRGIDGLEQPMVNATGVYDLTSSKDAVAETAAIRIQDPGTAKIGMVIYSDPAKVAGTMVVAAYDRATDAAVPGFAAVNLTEGNLITTTLPNRTTTSTLWSLDNWPEGAMPGWEGGGAYQQLDPFGDGQGRTYVAGVYVGYNLVDPLSSTYQSLAAKLEADGLSADAFARNLLVGSETQRLQTGTFFHEDILGTDSTVTTTTTWDGCHYRTTYTEVGGQDTIYGMGGDDYVLSKGGNDWVDGGTGNDTVDAGNGQDTVYGGAGNDLLNGQNGHDFLSGMDGNDILNGGSGSDSLTGDAGADVLDGGADSDRLWGGDGNDIVLGGDGCDYLMGEAGNDVLTGGMGRDVMSGGSGCDTFVFKSAAEIGNANWCNDNRDRITDFVSGQDKIDLSAIDANSLCGGNQSFNYIGGWCFSGWGWSSSWSAGELRYSCGVLSGDLNGDGCADFQLVLEGNPCLRPTDIIL
ncbi:M10 family metallopeptidase C-terminal domain-containing protein [Paracoccus sp. p3-h83]|uniref:M10 family metallopeptidase C-terminal domain-containing protein n=1 Tax=Paracoccus sp. p3-h83 TaxID=3342805 RepID=UPI0035B985A6